ncbi:hypothetical protein PIB30_053902 [Stylosanthes scabra]|uniref:Uncharacterized protein n=1 Tax=Stylosanthes scabra TaxID=79078 RepID=A0ABU6XH49_9FABA|nr:hypothetical protein [Stylosanthes scabra]
MGISDKSAIGKVLNVLRYYEDVPRSEANEIVTKDEGWVQWDCIFMFDMSGSFLPSVKGVFGSLFGTSENEFEVSSSTRWVGSQTIKMLRICCGLEAEPGLSREAPNAANSAKLRPGNLKAGPNLESGSCTDAFDIRIVALQKNKTLLETDDGKSPRLEIRSVSNLGPLVGARPAS